ncbi:MAG TPA: hypothetical protein VGR84_08080 [Candidatus Acidoferrales bacterium]|nr:hypothetical protein [Candidatus Acidoferrales bacterium]
MTLHRLPLYLLLARPLAAQVTGSGWKSAAVVSTTFWILWRKSDTVMKKQDRWPKASSENGLRRFLAARDAGENASSENGPCQNERAHNIPFLAACDAGENASSENLLGYGIKPLAGGSL